MEFKSSECVLTFHIMRQGSPAVSDKKKNGDWYLILLCLLAPLALGHSQLFICSLLFQEYNIHGWWVGELNGDVGIVPKDFLHPAYIL